MSTVASFCRNCGQPLNEREKAAGLIQCTGCGTAAQSSAQTGSYSGSYAPPPPYVAAPVPEPGVSPGLAFLLGLIPGVGAIYNGQYAKGLIHVFIFGLLMSIANEGRHEPAPLLVMMVAGFYFYMPFEAFHTAQKRQRGLPVDEFSSIVPLTGKATGLPVGPMVLIGVGVLFLLSNFDILRMSQIVRLWPVGLIGLGLVMLRERLRPSQSAPPPPPPPPTSYRPYGEGPSQPEASHE